MDQALLWDEFHCTCVYTRGALDFFCWWGCATQISDSPLRSGTKTWKKGGWALSTKKMVLRYFFTCVYLFNDWLDCKIMHTKMVWFQNMQCVGNSKTNVILMMMNHNSWTCLMLWHANFELVMATFWRVKFQKSSEGLFCLFLFRKKKVLWNW